MKKKKKKKMVGTFSFTLRNLWYISIHDCPRNWQEKWTQEKLQKEEKKEENDK